jgi:hypothetical protein
MQPTSHDRSRRQVLAGTMVLGAGLAAPFAVEANEHPTQETTRGHEPRRGLPETPRIRAAAELSLRNLLDDGFDDIFSRPFELDRVAADADLQGKIADLVVERIASPRRQHRPAASAIMLPKWRDHAYRKCVQLDPLDAANFLTLAVLVGEIVEPRRLAVHENRVFSHRFSPANNYLFDPRYTSSSFKATVLNKLSDERDTFLVQADISNFYPSIRIDRLTAALSESCVPEGIIEVLVDLLHGYESVGGLPIGPKASHIFAEAALVKADAAMIERGVDFVRFVDDYRLFASDAATAERWLGLVTDILESEGLSLNRAKTAISAVRRSDYAPSISHWDRTADAGDELGQGEKKKKKDEKKGKGRPPRPSASPTHRLPPAAGMIEQLKRIDTEKMLSELRAADYVSTDQFRLFAEAVLCRGEHHLLSAIFDILDRAPQCLPYLVQVLVDERQSVSKEVRNLVSAGFAERLVRGTLAIDYERLYAAKLLGTEGFTNPHAVRSYLSAGQPETSPIVLRALLDALAGRVSEDEARMLLGRYGEHGGWTRRAALRLLADQLDVEGRQALRQREQRREQWDPFVEVALRGSAVGET